MGRTRSDRTPYSPLTVSVTVSVVGRVAAGCLPAGGPSWCSASPLRSRAVTAPALSALYPSASPCHSRAVDRPVRAFPSRPTRPPAHRLPPPLPGSLRPSPRRCRLTPRCSRPHAGRTRHTNTAPPCRSCARSSLAPFALPASIHRLSLVLRAGGSPPALNCPPAAAGRAGHPEGRSGAEDGAAVDTPGLRRLSGRLFGWDVTVGVTPVHIFTKKKLTLAYRYHHTAPHPTIRYPGFCAVRLPQGFTGYRPVRT